MSGPEGDRSVVVGVDGGGTTTDAVIADLDGRVLGYGHGGPANWESVGARAMAVEVGRAVDAALRAADRNVADVTSAAYGLAGVDWDSDVAVVEGELVALGLRGPRVVVNDSHVALRAGCSRPWGIVSSVGTGAVTAGVNRHGTWFRTMAVGLGEPSGSGTLVKEALHAIAAHHHGTAAATSLTERFLAELGHSTVVEMYESITRGRSSVGAHHAPLVQEAASDGDAVARELIRSVAVRHADMVVGVARRLDMLDDDFELVMSGGVHRNGGLFGQDFEDRVLGACPRATPVPLSVSPAFGAATLALEAVGRSGHLSSAAGVAPGLTGPSPEAS